MGCEDVVIAGGFGGEDDGIAGSSAAGVSAGGKGYLMLVRMLMLSARQWLVMVEQVSAEQGGVAKVTHLAVEDCRRGRLEQAHLSITLPWKLHLRTPPHSFLLLFIGCEESDGKDGADDGVGGISGGSGGGGGGSSAGCYGGGGGSGAVAGAGAGGAVLAREAVAVVGHMLWQWLSGSIYYGNGNGSKQQVWQWRWGKLAGGT